MNLTMQKSRIGSRIGSGLMQALFAGALVVSAFVSMPDQTAKAAETVHDESSGQELYRRGFYPEALTEWKKAVTENNNPGAAFRLGEEYFDAKVVERDVPTAIKYYEIGAKGGDARAQMDLGSMYDKGWGVSRDASKAAKWYEAAAIQGMAEAQYNVATMYQAGEGVAKDDVKAYMYYMLAVKSGFPQFASKELEGLSSTMAPADIKKATIMARDFKPVVTTVVPTKKETKDNYPWDNSH
ncbi:MAG: tetratricopeptide repeat protein [Parvibaculum sp.]